MAAARDTIEEVIRFHSKPRVRAEDGTRIFEYQDSSAHFYFSLRDLPLKTEVGPGGRKTIRYVVTGLFAAAPEGSSYCVVKPEKVFVYLEQIYDFLSRDSQLKPRENERVILMFGVLSSMLHPPLEFTRMIDLPPTWHIEREVR